MESPGAVQRMTDLNCSLCFYYTQDSHTIKLNTPSDLRQAKACAEGVMPAISSIREINGPMHPIGRQKKTKMILHVAVIEM